MSTRPNLFGGNLLNCLIRFKKIANLCLRTQTDIDKNVRILVSLSYRGEEDMQRLIFYTKLNCHLCDDAYQVLMDVVNDIPLTINIVDITLPHRKNVIELYGERIPVLAKPEAGTELDWPFTSEDVRTYLLS